MGYQGLNIDDWDVLSAVARSVVQRGAYLMYERYRKAEAIVTVVDDSSTGAVELWTVYSYPDGDQPDGMGFVGARCCWRQDVDIARPLPEDRLTQLRQKRDGPSYPRSSAVTVNWCLR